MWNKQRYCWQLQNHVWIQNFGRSIWKITMLEKSAFFFVVIWHGGSCKEMGGTILWVGEQNDSTTLQIINSTHWWPSFQIRRIEIRGRTVTRMLSNCSENASIWHVLDLIFCGQWTNLQDRLRNGPKHVTNGYLVWFLAFIKWIQTILSCREHCQTMQIGTCFKTPI